MKGHLLLFVLGLMCISTTFAQRMVSGTIRDGAGASVSAVSVLEKGTSNQVISDADGVYSIQVKDGATLIFRSVGFTTLEKKITSANKLDVVLLADESAIDEVVVTALGIKKEKKALGYAVQDIKADELMKNKNPNMINSLNGKIAGLNITNSGGAPGSSASIIIRGGTSLERDNQPLFVIDGMLMDNSTGVGDMSAFDGNRNISTTNGNRAMDINPEDIESISVLKGPTAAALYGIRAAAGAIVITTKKGKDGVTSIGVNSTIGSNTVNRLPETQQLYKQGTNLDNTGVRLDTYNSWGDRFAAGEQRYDNMKDFFKTGYTYDNNFNVSGGNPKGTFFLSGANLKQTGIVPTTDYGRTNFRFNGEQKLGILTVGATAAYSQSKTTKTLTGNGLYGSGGNGYMESIIAWPQSVDMRDYQNSDGSQKFLFTNGSTPIEILANAIDNPYWTIYRNPQNDKTNRFLGTFYTNAQLTDWLSFTYRLGVDNYTSTYTSKISAGSATIEQYQKGMLSQNITQFNFLNNNVLLNASKRFAQVWDVNLLMGLSTEDRKVQTTANKAQNFVIPNFYSFNNANQADKFTYDNISNKRNVGVFGDLKVGYKDLAYVGVTLRNDWTSTLTRENRSFMFPSYSASLIFSELIPSNDILSYGKLRVSYAGVGKDTDPYKTATYLDPVEQTIGGGYKNSYTLGNPYLVPERTQSFEVGTDLRFFRNRLGLEFTYYNNESIDQILSPRFDNAIGAIFKLVNAGVLQNKGVELSMNYTAIKKQDFTWDMTLNWSHNEGKVKQLPSDLSILYVTDVQVSDGKAASYNDGDFMAISGKDWTKNADGKYILNWATGLPTVNADATRQVGNREPDFIGGLNNNFRYKNWNLSFLLDFRKGGDVFNATDVLMTQYGLSKRTESRGNTIQLSGVALNPTTNQYEDVTRDVVADQNYYSRFYINKTSHFIENVNWLRLRSVNLSYSLPNSVLAKSKIIKGASFTLNATNLLLITNYSGMDPEISAAGAGVIGSGSVGIDYAGVPNTRGVTFGVNFKF